MNESSVDAGIAAENERSRRTLWSETKDVYDREYSNARKMGLDVAAATEHTDAFYDERFGLDRVAPDYSAALVQLALSPELATPPKSIDRRASLDEARAAALQAASTAAKLQYLTREQLDAQSLPQARPGTEQSILDKLEQVRAQQATSPTTPAPAEISARGRQLQ